jgi:hypothetical protein
VEEQDDDDDDSSSDMEDIAPSPAPPEPSTRVNERKRPRRVPYQHELSAQKRHGRNFNVDEEEESYAAFQMVMLSSPSSGLAGQPESAYLRTFIQDFQVTVLNRFIVQIV